MTEKQLDITGEVCPFCLLIVKRELKNLNSGSTLIVKLDHPPAAKDNIPAAMKKAGHRIETKLLEPGLWELHIVKQ
ncbi:sulfurtransferase TusA family protein [Candidatus Bathyarchaeota archaeon]|nr:sulfurtransferase TusA family protein [Candidatus Bathyarchaeota archaeon]